MALSQEEWDEMERERERLQAKWEAATAQRYRKMRERKTRELADNLAMYARRDAEKEAKASKDEE
jgi:hypothetical protein